MTIYDNFADYNRNFTNDACMICHECGYVVDTCQCFWTDERNGKSICMDCTEKHYRSGDPGIYPVERPLGIVSSSMLLFTDWSEFFKMGAHSKHKWEIVRYDRRLWMREIYDGHTIDRYRLIATEEMIEEFDRIQQ